MPESGPRSEVFTTVLVRNNGSVADWSAHLNRLHEHAKRLRLSLPNDPPEIAPPTNETWQLARISCSSTELAWVVNYRPVQFRDEAIEAITVPAPRWNERTNGTKHGDWSAYTEAHELAEQAGFDAALLVHDYAIVDGDRGTPLVLDEDGTVWMASSSEGGVDGVTAGVLEALLPTVGLPVVKGKLNERTVARCAELVLVGTGMGACHVSSLDGVALGSSTALSSACQRLLSQHFTEEGTWSSLGAHHV